MCVCVCVYICVYVCAHVCIYLYKHLFILYINKGALPTSYHGFLLTNKRTYFDNS